MDLITTPTTGNLLYSWRYVPLLLLLVASVLILYLSPLNSTTLFPFRSLQQHSPPANFDELEAVLRRASMGDNKTVIIAVVNKAYVEGEVVPNMLDLFLEGFWHGEGTRDLVNRLVIVAVDQTSYDRCSFRRLHCYRLSTDVQDFMAEEVYMSSGFIKMMWRRTLFLIQVLKKGYNFIFTDMDVIWLRNPFPALTTNHIDSDIQFSTDHYNGDSLSTKNPINTGFYYVKSNNRTISLFEKWYSLKDKYPEAKDQDVLQAMAWEGVFDGLSLKVRFLQTRLFSGFCQDTTDVRLVITVHANCCKFISAKVVDLGKVLHQWVRFRGTSSNHTTPLRWSKHKECPKSWKKNTGH